MREAWTDERLDDLNAKVDEGFRRQEVQMAELRTEIRTVRSEMNGRFDSMHRVMVVSSVSLVVGFLGVIASILVTGA